MLYERFFAKVLSEYITVFNQTVHVTYIKPVRLEKKNYIQVGSIDFPNFVEKSLLMKSEFLNIYVRMEKYVSEFI